MNIRHSNLEIKIQLNMLTSFISSKSTGETCNINILSDNEKIMWAYETENIINDLFIFLKNNYQLEEQIMREDTDFKFQSADRLDYKLPKIKLRREGSYIESPKWVRNKRATINDNYFQYALTFALNYQNIEIIQKEYQILFPLLMIIIANGQIFHHTETVKKKVRSQKILCCLTIKSLNKIMGKLPRIYYLYPIIKKK